MAKGQSITFGVLAAIIAAKARMSGSKKETADLTGIPLDMWLSTIESPFQNNHVMDMLTRNMFIHPQWQFYSDFMIFEAENLGQLYNPEMCPINYYASQINQEGVQVLFPGGFEIPLKLSNYDPQFLFAISLSKPNLKLTLRTSHLIADTIGPQYYFDCYQMLLSEEIV